MYARRKFCHLTGTRAEAELLGELKVCWMVLLQSTPDSLGGVRGLYCRIGGLPKKAALYFCCEGRSVLLHTEGALCVSIDCYNPVRSWHLELEVGIMRHRIESGKCGSSEQCMIATAEGDDIED